MAHNDYKLKNFMEDIIFSIIDEMLEDKHICKCERCRLDIAAIALNHLPAKYVVTDKGQAYAKTELLNRQFHTDILIQLLKAIDIVSKRPYHN